MKILVFNAGSSTLKYALFIENFDGLAKFSKKKFERTINDSNFSNGENQIVSGKMENLKNSADYKRALGKIISELKEKNMNFDVIGHRVVHGGPLKESCLINSKVEKIIEKFSELAPLHNPVELEIIKDCKKFKKKQFAVFDTAFFHDLPDRAKIYPIPKKISDKFEIRRYGFHGTSHKFVSRGLAGKTITCHIGSGASISSIVDGKAVDTSMGFTPMEGLMMGTRAGDIDSGLVLFLEKKGYDANKLLNFESGFKAFLKENDFTFVRDNLNKPEVKLVFDMFVYRIVKYIGAYSAAMNGLDNLVFTAGIGENSDLLRKEIAKNLGFLGLELDEGKNKSNAEIISSANSKIKVYVRKTNEEFLIAKEVMNLTNGR